MPAPPDPPTGVVTFLFSDIQGSTRLWEEHPEPMQRALARHDALMRRAIVEAGGHVFKTGGDAFYTAFGRPEDALASALAMQKALHAEPWDLPEGRPLRVRLALHAGAAELREGDYFGAAPGRAARLLGAAHGGQTLVSEATAALLDALPEGVSLRSLGRHRLKDLTQPQEIFQLAHPDLPGDFPPPRSLESFQHNLPGQLTSFVGREHEMGQARAGLKTSRLVTLTGTGGSGKTRLAVQVAADALDDFPDGAWLVELAPLSEGDLVVQTVAGVFGLGEEPDRRLLDTLADALRPKSLLLVLDNCEHLIDACARLAETLLRACPKLKILATSREALDIPGECALPLSSLGLPPGPPLPPLGELLAGSSSVRLFVERAASARPGFRLDDGNAGAVTQVCARLDGIPLALELAAARVKVLSPEQIMGRLDDRFRLLTGGSRTALPRQQTLRALIDWSYDLLPESEKTLFRRLSVFSGGWSLDAAEAVCAGDDVEDWEVLDLLSHLVAKSLVVVDPPADGQVRYRLLENLRRYGGERLAEAGEADALAGRHLAWFLRYAEEAEPHLIGPEQVAWLHRLARDHDNLRAALRFCREGGGDDGEAGLRLSKALYRFWLVRGFLSEGGDWLHSLLTAPGAAGVPETVRANALNAYGVLTWSCGDFAASHEAYQECLDVKRRLGDRAGVAGALNNLAMLTADQGKLDAARQLYEDSLAAYRELDERGHVASVLINLSGLGIELGDFGTAREQLEEGIRLFQEVDYVWGLAVAHDNLGNVCGKLGDFPAARSHLHESLQLLQRLEDKAATAAALTTLAFVLTMEGREGEAARLFGASEVLREALGVPPPPSEQEDHRRYTGRVRERLGAEPAEQAWRLGRTMNWPAATEYAQEAALR